VYINYVVLKISARFIEMLQIYSLLVTSLWSWFLSLVTRTPLTPRELYNSLRPPPPWYATQYTTHLIVFTITLTYSTIHPIIMPFSMLYFGVSLLLHSYQFLYVYQPLYDTGGLMWPIVFERVVVGMEIWLSTMSGYFLLKQAWVQGVGMLGVAVGTWLFKLFVTRTFKRRGNHLAMWGVRRPSIRELRPEPPDQLVDIEKQELDTPTLKRKSIFAQTSNRIMRTLRHSIHLPNTEGNTLSGWDTGSVTEYFTPEGSGWEESLGSSDAEAGSAGREKGARVRAASMRDRIRERDLEQGPFGRDRMREKDVAVETTEQDAMPGRGVVVIRREDGNRELGANVPSPLREELATRMESLPANRVNTPSLLSVSSLTSISRSPSTSSEGEYDSLSELDDLDFVPYDYSPTALYQPLPKWLWLPRDPLGPVYLYDTLYKSLDFVTPAKTLNTSQPTQTEGLESSKAVTVSYPNLLLNSISTIRKDADTLRLSSSMGHLSSYTADASKTANVAPPVVASSQTLSDMSGLSTATQERQRQAHCVALYCHYVSEVKTKRRVTVALSNRV
jgi:hypothetical protein